MIEKDFLYPRRRERGLKTIFLVCVFFLLAYALMGPITSNKTVTDQADYPTHIGSVIQAKMALHEHQFPPRTGPWENNGWGNPWFQFYAPLPHIFGAMIYSTLSPSNPFTAIKIAIWLVLALSGFYIYKIIDWLLASRITAFLAGVVYMTAPYFLININVRGDFKEAFAQGLLPLGLYYTLRLFLHKQTWQGFLLTAIFWSVLACTCLLTFIYSSLFVGLFLVIYTLYNRPFWKPYFITAAAYFYGCFLAMWFLAPIGLIEKYLMIDSGLSNPANWSIFTRLSVLLSPTAVNPDPANLWLSSHHLYCAVGWPILAGVGVVIYFLATHRFTEDRKLKKLVLSFLMLFFLAFFMTWTPINFWGLLPKFLVVAQFPYRLLTQVMWIGTILFAYGLYWLFDKKIDIRHAILGTLVLGLFVSSWLPQQDSGQNQRKVIEITQSPSFDYGWENYLADPKKIKKYGIEIAELNASNSIPVERTQEHCSRQKSMTICQLGLPATKTIQLPVFYYPKLLDIQINGQKADYFPSAVGNHLLATVKLPPGDYLIQAYFRGFWWANWCSALAWVGLITGGLILILRRLATR